MAIASQALTDSYNLQAAIYKAQMVDTYNKLSEATDNKIISTMNYENAKSVQPAGIFIDEKNRLLAKYPIVGADFTTENRVSYDRQQQINRAFLTVLPYYTGAMIKVSSPNAISVFELMGGNNTNLFYNDPLWPDLAASISSKLYPYIKMFNDTYVQYLNDKAKWDEANTAHIVKLRDVDKWVAMFVTYDNIPVKSAATLLEIALTPPAPPIIEAITPPPVILQPIPEPVVLPPVIPADIPRIPLEETPLSAVEATKISNETGPSRELSSPTQKITLAPPKSNTGLLLAGAALLGYFMMKKKGRTS